MASIDSMDVETASLKYFSHMNYMTKRIVCEEKTFRKYLGGRWNELPAKHKDSLIDLLIVGDAVRETYTVENMKNKCSRQRDGTSEIQESFPRLYINSGNKINVDFEDDLWTWKDEHSGPFCWMSKSQQDLTLASLEPDNILKPQPKSMKVDVDEEAAQKVAEPQFTYPCSSWCHSVVDDFLENEKDVVLTPSVSIHRIGGVTDKSSDDANTASQEYSNGTSHISGPDDAQDTVTDAKDFALPLDRKSSGKDRNRRSPSPKKMIRSGSFKKSPSKSSDYGERKLIVVDPDSDDRTNAFSNPVMESEWSTFVGNSHSEDLTPSDAQESPITGAPGSLTMDRGDHRGDYVCLTDQTDSPAMASSKSVSCVDGSEWSTQSTPDHNTCLLKGVQSPVHHQPIKFSSLDMSDEHQPPADLVPEQTEEVLRVEREGDKIVVTTQIENKRDSDCLKTGFDFLDDW